jgi:hypothetical protein
MCKHPSAILGVHETIVVRSVVEHRGEPTDGHQLAITPSCQVVPL